MSGGPDGLEERTAEADEASEHEFDKADIADRLADEARDTEWLSRSVDDMQWPTRILVSPVIPRGGK